MTDTGAALWLLVMCLLLAAAVNVSLLLAVGRQWLQAVHRRTNGPQLVIVRGTARRILLRLIMQVALLAWIWMRVRYGRPAPASLTAFILLVLFLAFVADAVGDVFDYRVLRWMLRFERSDDEPA